MPSRRHWMPHVVARVPVLAEGQTWGFSASRISRNIYGAQHHVLVGENTVTSCSWQEGIPIEESPLRRSSICRACLKKLETEGKTEK